MVKEDHRTAHNSGMIYKFFITLSGSLLSLSFGTMLGWPSPTYPALLTPNGTVQITLDESALIAGMLMNGFVISTPFSGVSFMNSKHGVMLGTVLVFSGWIVLYFAQNVLMLCTSRLCIGVGTGFGLGKFKFYIQEILNPDLVGILQKGLVVFTGVGVATSFIVGPFLSFRLFSIMAAVIPAVSFVTFIFAPESPRKYYVAQKTNKAAHILQKVNGKEYIQQGLDKLKKNAELKTWNIFQILRNKYKRKSLLTLTLIMTIQQFTGGPALIVYSQLIFTEFGYFAPHYYAILYSVLFLLSTYVGVRYMHTFQRKSLLLISTFISTLMSFVHLTFLYFRPDDGYLNALPVVTMSMFAMSHSVGLAIVPGLMVNDMFGDSCKFTVNCYVNMYTAELAVIVTKIFQTMFGLYGMFSAFGLFSSVGLFGLVVILCFFEETKDFIVNN